MKRNAVEIIAGIVILTILVVVAFVAVGNLTSKNNKTKPNTTIKPTTIKPTTNTKPTTKDTTVTYNVTYVLDGGTNSSDNPSTFTNKDSIILKDASKEGFEFKGWYTEATFQNKITKLDSNITSDITLYAKFEEIVIVYDYSIIYHLDDGINNPNNPSGFMEDETFTLLPATKLGYDFMGWYTTDAYTNEVTEIEFNFDYELYAKFEIHEYTITYNNVDGLINTNPNTYTINYGTINLKPVNKEYCNFLGWYTTSTFDEDSKITSIDSQELKDYVLYAKFEIVPVDATINVTPKDLTYNTFDQELLSYTVDGGVAYFSLDNINFSLDIPKGKNAGDYIVYYKVIGDEYHNDLDVDHIVIHIEKATYDMSSVEFNDKSVIYNGDAQSITITGTLPEGVSVTYENNEGINVGNYNTIAKFNGDYDNYNIISDMTATLTITKATYDMSKVNFNDDEFTYDGQAHGVYIEGNIPAGVTVEYENNDKINYGTYTVIAKFTGDSTNYELISDMTATLKINKAVYDMSGITFDDETVVYDGNAHSLEISGTLPSGVTVSYENNGKTTVGTYVVTANFTGDSTNYELISDMTATLIISKKAYDMSGVEFNNKTVTYTGSSNSIEITGELPEGVTVSYENNGKINAGTYTITAKFVGDATNYELIPNKTAILTINKAVYDIEVSFLGDEVTYDGNVHSLAINGTLPEGVTVSYENNDKVNVGIYTVIAKFNGDYDNYNVISDMTATLTINKATYDMSDVSFNDLIVTYDGSSKSIVISGSLPTGVTVEYTGNGKISFGEYTITAKFSGDYDNYNVISDMTATLTINKATYDMSEITFEGVELTYDGNAHSLEISGTLPTGVAVEYENNDKVNVGTYTVIAKFMSNNPNYEEISNMEATLIINKAVATYTLPTAKDNLVYNENNQALVNAGSVSAGSLEYSLDGETWSTNIPTATTPNTYNVSYRFVLNDNYEAIDGGIINVLIDKATIDMSNIELNDKTVTYDGNAQTIVITGTLNPNVTVNYDGEGTSVGTYQITATFTVDETLYNAIDDLEATLTITPATIKNVIVTGYTAILDYNAHNIVVSKSATTVDSCDATWVYSIDQENWVDEITVTNPEDSGTYYFKISAANHNDYIGNFEVVVTEKNVTTIEITNLDSLSKVYDGTCITTPSISTNNELGTKTITYSLDGTTFTETMPKNAGHYTIKVEVSETDTYAKASIQKTFDISKATYDMSKVKFEGYGVVYTGDVFSVIVYGTLPEGVTVAYEGNEKVNVGTYTVIAKFSGDYDNYNEIDDMTAELEIMKATYNMSGVTFANDTITYDGNVHSLAISGSLPSGVTVSYENNDNVNAGTYEVTAKFSGDYTNYNVILNMFATLKINKATYDMSGVTFDDSTIPYDGLSHKLTISGTLPMGVSVTYSDTASYTEVGEYEYTASFSGDEANYELIDSMTATLTINKATIDTSVVVFDDLTVTYDGTAKSITATNIPDHISVEYTGNGKTNAGTYTVTVTLVYDENCYNVTVASKTATLTIEKKEIDTSVVVFDNLSVTYDKTNKSILATNIPTGVTVEYSGNGQKNAGTYTVTATFVYDTTNYTVTVESMTAILTIEKAIIDMSAVTFENKTFTYDGNIKSIAVSDNLPIEITKVNYTDNDKVNAGIYTVIASFEYDTDNYNEVSNMSATLTINKKEIDNSNIELPDATYTYDGSVKSLSYTGVLPSEISGVNYSGNNQINAGEHDVVMTFNYDTTNYTLTVLQLYGVLTINKATPTTSGITVKYDEGIGSFFSTNKSTSSIVFNGTYNVEGTISYSDARENLEIGTLSYSYTFTPTDTTNYEIVNGTVEIITKATVKYYDDSTLLNTLYVAKNDNATNLSLPTKVGYTADGWTLYNSSALYDFATLVTTNLNLYTKYTLETYTINYVLGGGTNNPSNPSSYNITTNTITLLDATKDNYDFLGWYTENTFTNKITQITKGSTGNYTLYAYFVEIPDDSIFITYHLNGGTNNPSNPSFYTTEDSSFELLNPTKGNAYTFAGWYLDSSFTNRIVTVDPSVMSENFDVYAKWSALQYSIMYYYGSKRITDLNPKSYTIEDTVTLPTYSVYNHTFNGWYTDSALTNPITTIPAGSTGTVKVYAKLTDNGFTVNFYDTNKTTLLKSETTSTYGSVTAPSYTYDNSKYILKWVDKSTNELVDLSYIDANYDVFVELVVISYTASIYYVDADGYSTAKTGSPIITSKTIDSLTYGDDISLYRQMRVTDASTYDLFYMSPINSFDWSLVVASIASGTSKNASDGSTACYAIVEGTTGTIRIYVFCIQPVAIITASNQSLAFAQNLDMSTSTYEFYSTIDSAFETFHSSTNKLMRIYGRYNGTLASNCFGNTTNVTIASVSEAVDEITITRPKLIYNCSDYILHNSYTLTSGKIILPYSRKCTDTVGYRLQNTTANSTAHIHSMFAIDSNVTLTLSIDFTIGGDIINGSSLNGRGVVMNNGTIILTLGNTIKSYGFLKGLGSLIIESGATLVDYFFIYDWPGGANGLGFFNKNIFPFEVYSFHNVSCNTRIYAGSTYKAWCQLYIGDGFVSKDMVLVGNGGLFQLSNGYIDKAIKETTSNIGTNTNYTSSNLNQTVKDIIDIHGDFSDNSISIHVKLSKSGITIAEDDIATSTTLALPIGFMEIIVSEGNGTLSKNSYKFLPGSALTIKNHASVTINNGVKVIFYDEYPDDYTYTQGDSTKSGAANTYSYQNKHSAIYTNGLIKDGYAAKLIVDGTLIVKGNLGGKIYTTSSTGSLSLSNTSATLPKPTSLTYGSTGSSCNSTNETIPAKIYLLVDDSFVWTNASAITYSSIEHSGEYGFISNNSANSFTITYNYGSSTSTSVIHTSFESHTIEEVDLFNIELEGYTFDGWFTNNSYTTPALGYTITSDITLYAKLTPIIYNIEYHTYIVDDYDEESQITNSNNTYFTFDNSVSLIPAICGDLTFYGWYIDEDFSVNAPNINSTTFDYYKYIMEDNTIHLYGYFSSIAMYSIVYRDQNGLIIDSIPSDQINAGESITLANALESYQSTEGLDTTLYAFDLYEFSKWIIFDSNGNMLGQYNANASYTPASSITVVPYYAKTATYVTISPGTISNASYTVTYSGGSGNSNAPFAVPKGTTLTISITYSESDNKTWSYNPASGSSSTSTTQTANYNATISASSTEGSCVVEGTLITMADGTKKKVEDIVAGDLLLVFNHETGEYDVSFVLFNDAEELANYTIINLEFSNGSIVKVVSEHGFFDLDLMKYVYITESNYNDFVNHRFYAYGGEIVTLDNAYITVEETRVYSPVTAYHLNYFTEDLLSMPGGVEGLFNIFEYDETLKYDEEKKANDIATYGLFTYEDFEDMIPEEIYEVFNGAYLKIAIAKGLVTFEQIAGYAERYGIYW